MPYVISINWIEYKFQQYWFHLVRWKYDFTTTSVIPQTKHPKLAKWDVTLGMMVLFIMDIEKIKQVSKRIITVLQRINMIKLQ